MDSLPTILFVCEHGVAKSVVAAAYFNHFARAQNLQLRAIARGTTPDDEITLKAAEGLQTDGIDIGDLKPQRLFQEDITNAKRVVTFCQLPEEYRVNITYVDDWSGVPPVGEDYNKSRNVIVGRIKKLLESI